jgi:acyl-CoA synthetase (AMP-forming)/AMP-acid ligase II
MQGVLPSSVEEDTLVHRLHRRAVQQPEQVAYTFLRYSDASSKSLTYRDLDRSARSLGAHLRKHGARNRPVLLFFPSGLEYVVAYFGCLYAGAIAVPAYVPHSARDFPRIQAIIADTQAEIVLTTQSDYARVARRVAETPALAHLVWIAIDSLEICEGEVWQSEPGAGEGLAFLQYTSGSTAAPRGVMVSHNNLMHNLAAIHAHWGVDDTEQPAGVYWLPLFHDMGLIMGILAPLYSGYPVYFMSPADFLQRPLRWLQAISDYRGTFSCAPNFAYELCVRRIATEDLAGLDLRCWRGAGNASEAVRHHTFERFQQFFATCGFSQTAFRPAYGLAEATLLVAAGYQNEPVHIQAVSKPRLEEGYIEGASSPTQEVQHLVGCGSPIEGQRVVIVDPETLQPCEEAKVGEIWVAGPSIAQGYWRHPEETVRTFQARLAGGQGPFLRTGDLGVLQDTHLFITGRLKDLIILGGRNLYPQDLEFTVEQAHPAIRAGHCVAFSAEGEGEERLIILAEIDRRYHLAADGAATNGLDTRQVIESVRRAIAERHEVRTQQVLLLRPGDILKTSSGKVQRRACRSAFLQGTLQAWEG